MKIKPHKVTKVTTTAIKTEVARLGAMMKAGDYAYCLAAFPNEIESDPENEQEKFFDEMTKKVIFDVNVNPADLEEYYNAAIVMLAFLTKNIAVHGKIEVEGLHEAIGNFLKIGEVLNGKDDNVVAESY